MMMRKFGAVFAMFNILANGITGQHREIGENQLATFKNLSDQHSILENAIKKDKEVFSENDYH